MIDRSDQSIKLPVERTAQKKHSLDGARKEMKQETNRWLQRQKARQSQSINQHSSRQKACCRSDRQSLWFLLKSPFRNLLLSSRFCQELLSLFSSFFLFQERLFFFFFFEFRLPSATHSVGLFRKDKNGSKFKKKATFLWTLIQPETKKTRNKPKQNSD